MLYGVVNDFDQNRMSVTIGIVTHGCMHIDLPGNFVGLLTAFLMVRTGILAAKPKQPTKGL
jgi:hypothetical protein